MQTNDHVLNSAPVDSYGASISRFMNWAAERIAKEVEDNERLEALAGTRDMAPCYESNRHDGWQNFTMDEKVDLLKQVDRLREQGHTVKSAAFTVGIHNTTYYKWKKELNK